MKHLQHLTPETLKNIIDDLQEAISLSDDFRERYELAYSLNEANDQLVALTGEDMLKETN